MQSSKHKLDQICGKEKNKTRFQYSQNTCNRYFTFEPCMDAQEET